MLKLNKRNRFNYWSCSKFANWIRGTEKPFALGWDEWKVWRKESEKKHPFRYWIAEKGLNTLQNIVNFPCDIYHTLYVYVRNRYIDKIHYLKTGLKPGEYYDIDYRILHGLFNELVIHVEHELAHLSKYKSDKKYKFIKGRCEEAGLDYLNWSGQLKMNEDYGINPDNKDYNKPTAQAIAARKVLKLYNWWKNRDNRTDPYSIFTKEKDGKSYYKKIAKMMDDYDKEDTKMLVDLIKIRQDLWT